MESKDKIDIALRAGIVAREVLSLVGTSGKFHAKIVMVSVVKSVMELDQKIQSLPEE